MDQYIGMIWILSIVRCDKSTLNGSWNSGTPEFLEELFESVNYQENDMMSFSFQNDSICQLNINREVLQKIQIAFSGMGVGLEDCLFIFWARKP